MTTNQTSTMTGFRTLVLGVAMVCTALTAGRAQAAGSYGLQLGSPRSTATGTIAVPIRLRLPKNQRVAAMNFTVRYDATQLEVAENGVVPTPSLRRTRADLHSRVETAPARVRTIVIPEFTRDFASLRAGRIATLYLRPRGGAPKALRRWVARNVHLEGVVLGDPEGRELHLRDRANRS